MHQLDVVQRHFSGLQEAGHRIFFVDLDRDFLAARQQVVLVEGVDVRQLVLLVRAGNPVEWNIGEAAGALAAFALEQGVAPAAVREQLLEDFQERLRREGVPLAWPDLGVI